MSSLISSGTAGGALEFLDLLIDKGRASSGSVTPLKTALRQVLSVVDGEGWEKTDVRGIDAPDHIGRFSNLTAGKYNSDSLRTYQSRLKKAISWYSSFLADPGWTPPKSGVAPQRPPKAGVATATTRPREVTLETPTSRQTEPNPVKDDQITTESLVAYPFPLRVGKMVQLYLPADLTLLEAKRLSKFVESLSVDTES